MGWGALHSLPPNPHRWGTLRSPHPIHACSLWCGLFRGLAIPRDSHRGLPSSEHHLDSALIPFWHGSNLPLEKQLWKGKNIRLYKMGSIQYADFCYQFTYYEPNQSQKHIHHHPCIWQYSPLLIPLQTIGDINISRSQEEQFEHVILNYIMHFKTRITEELQLILQQRQRLI